MLRRLAVIWMLLALAACTPEALRLSPEWPVPHSGEDAVTVLAWVAESVSYRSDIDGYGVADYWATPLETYASHRGDCEDHSILALYLLHRDAGVTGEMVAGADVVDGDGHAWVRVDGQDWEPQSGATLAVGRYTELWSMDYDTLMGEVGYVREVQ